jgi:hypothetical protein
MGDEKRTTQHPAMNLVVAFWLCRSIGNINSREPGRWQQACMQAPGQIEDDG